MSYTAITKNVDGWWIGWIEEIPGVNCQEKTHDKLLSSLKDTLLEALDLNKADARNAAGSNFTEEKIMV